MSDMIHEVVASVSPRSLGPNSVFDPAVEITRANVGNYVSAPDDLRDARRVLAAAGFRIFEEASTDQLIQIGGPAKLFRQFFNARLSKRKAAIGPGLETSFMGTGDEAGDALLLPPDEYRDLIEGAVVARPPIFFAPSPIPPIAQVDAGAYPYFTVPDGIAVALRAAQVHRLGVTGKGIVVAMPDTGMYAHPFYSARGYRVMPTLLAPGAADPGTDTVGHGTGEAANVFACAPDVRLIPVKMGNDATGAINMAVNASPRPHVMTNSWGYDADEQGTAQPVWLKPLEVAISNAVANGIVMCFSAGNGQHSFPGSHPDVISVGGVHMNLPDLDDIEASSYASSFRSTWYPGRSCPDLCGLTGRRVTIDGGGKAPSILLPVEEGADLDRIAPPTGGARAGSDGWGLFSGTSAASPQIAGIVALMLERNPRLTPAEVRDRLTRSARDVTKGETAMGDRAAAGPDLATGAGLADAKWAVLGTIGEVASRFFAAPKEEQIAMVSSGRVPAMSPEFVGDLIDTLRSR